MIRNLTYRHPQKKTAAVVNAMGILDPLPAWKKPSGLKEIDLDIRRGQRIALIGESGCGKSTLLTLLRGLNRPTSEALMEVDGSISDFSSVVDSVTLLPQEPEIFEATFEYNITMGLPFSREQVDRVCELTRLSLVLKDMDEGLSTRIIEKGQNLSGGQKQRLALARGVLAAHSSTLILMDEPTSSMDPKTEQEVYLNMFREFEGKTVISTLHRLHLLHHFDYIHVMHEGRIVEEGTLRYLLRNGEMFRKLWDHQRNNHQPALE
jgi:ABC-type bacteriocin/lantibiotic exporter with double-glycine peptidase domain